MLSSIAWNEHMGDRGSATMTITILIVGLEYGLSHGTKQLVCDDVAQVQRQEHLSAFADNMPV